MLRQMTVRNNDGSYPENSFCLLEHKEYNQQNRELVMIDTHHGLVIRCGEHNYYDDSDFYAIVWNEELQAPEKIIYATTRAWTYSCGCIVDASEDVMKKYSNYVDSKTKEHKKYNQKLKIYIPKIGRLARSTTTRGKAKDKQGIISWIGNSKYSSSKVVKIDSCFVETDRLELWDETNEVWVKSASYLSKLNTWFVPESILPHPKPML